MKIVKNIKILLNFLFFRRELNWDKSGNNNDTKRIRVVI